MFFPKRGGGMHNKPKSNHCYFGDTKDLNEHIGDVKPLLFC